MTRLILLGTAGGPRPNAYRSQPAQVIVVEEVPYLVDCGWGVGRQFVRAGIPLRQLGNVFITHQHSDHNGDYGNVLYQAWISGRADPIDTYGPPPIERMTEDYLRLNAYDLDCARATSYALNWRRCSVPIACLSPALFWRTTACA